MRHPNQAALALHAGGDLSAFARWRMERHLAACAQCRAEVAAFGAVRNATSDLGELPELQWSLMAAEMRANIRLGLAAGECVRPAENRIALRLRWRPVVAMAGIAALVMAGFMYERPRLLERQELSRADATLMQTAADGIGSQSLRLMYRGAKDVQLAASANGSLQAHYTDPSTSYMTVSEVDAQ